MNSSNIQKTLDKLYKSMLTFLGVISETMPRDNSFLLLDTGKIIERILSKISIIQSNFGVKNEANVENELIEATLLNHHLLVNYRLVYKSQLNLEAMLDMVLFEKSLPYSIVYLLDSLKANLEKLPEIRGERLNDAQKAVLEASTLINLASVSSLSQYDEFSLERKELFHLMSKVSRLISSVSMTLTNMYFSHTVMQHSFFKPVENDEI